MMPFKSLLLLAAATVLLFTVSVEAKQKRAKINYPPAEFCNPATLEGCKGRQAEYAEKMRRKSLKAQRYELSKLKRATRYEDEADWIDDRMIILENVIDYTIHTKGDDEL